MYPTGRTMLVYVKLRDKCKMENTLFSNFSFFFLNWEKTGITWLKWQKTGTEFWNHWVKIFVFYIDIPGNDPVESCSRVMSSRRDFYRIDCIEGSSLSLFTRTYRYSNLKYATTAYCAWLPFSFIWRCTCKTKVVEMVPFNNPRINNLSTTR